MKKTLLSLVLALPLAFPALAQERAIAVLRATEKWAGSEGKVVGHVWFTKVDNGLKIQVKIRGLAPNSTHGFHVHQFGDLSAGDASSAGPHFSPDDRPHGGPHSGEHHAGDLGNVKADANGNVDTTLTVDFLSLEGEHSVLGRSVILHAKADDLKSQPSGDSGDRIGAGVIGIAGDKWGVAP